VGHNINYRNQSEALFNASLRHVRWGRNGAW